MRAMLVAAHIVEVVVMFAAGAVIAMRLRRGTDLPWALFGAGMLIFVFAQVTQIAAGNFLSMMQAEGRLAFLAGEGMRGASYALMGVLAGFSQEPIRAFVLRRYVPGYRSQRSAAVVGAGAAAAEGILTGAVVLMMFGIAVYLRGETIESLEALGVTGRAAVKVGLRAVAWWEASPLEAVYATVGYLGRAAYQVGITCAMVASLTRARWLLGVLLASILSAAVHLATEWAADPAEGLSSEGVLAVHVGVGLLGIGLVVLARRAAASDPAAIDRPEAIADAVQ